MNTLFVLLSLTIGWIILPSKVLVFAIQVYEHHDNDLTTASTVLMMITPPTTGITPTSTTVSSIVVANNTGELSEDNGTDIETSRQSNLNKTDESSVKLQPPADLLHIESNINATGPVQYPTNEPSPEKVFLPTNESLHTPRIAEPFLGGKHHQIDQQQKSTIAHHINHKKFIPSPQVSAGIINTQIPNNNKRENFLPSNQYYKPLSYEPYYNYKIPATVPTTPPTTIKPISPNSQQQKQQELSQQFQQQQSAGKQIEMNDGFIVSSGPYYPKFEETPNHYQHHHQHYHELSKPKINWSIQAGQQPATSPNVATPPSGPGGTTIICDPPPSTLQFPENGKWYWLPNSTPEIPIIPEKPSSPPVPPSPPHPQTSVVSSGVGSGNNVGGIGGSTSDAWKWIFENNTPKLVPNHQNSNAHHPHHQLIHSSHPYSFELISTAGPPPSQGSPFSFPAGGESVPQPPSYGSGGLEFSEWPPMSLPPTITSSSPQSPPMLPPQFIPQYFIKEDKLKQNEENTGKESDDTDDGGDNEEDAIKSPKKKPNLRPKGLSPLKKILSVLGIALPIGLLISTLTPQVVVVSPNATSPLRPIIPGINIGGGGTDSLRSKYDYNNYLNNGFFHKSFLHRSVDNNNNNNNNNMDGISDDINNSEINIANIQLDPNELSEWEQNLSVKNPLIDFLTILDKQHKSSIHDSSGGSDDVDADDKHECDSRQFCEVARLGSTPNANVLNRMLWKVANKTSKSQAIKSGLYEIFRAIRNNNCKVFICKNYQPYQSLQQINHQNVSSDAPSQQQQQHPAILYHHP